ncbi:potassium channel, subfamily K, member 16-like [Lissotriton helveticus]
MCTAKLRKSVLLSTGYLCYLLAGAAVFQWLEQGAETEVKHRTSHHKLAFLRNFTCLQLKDLERLIEVIEEAVKQGIHPLGNTSGIDHSNWDFSSSFFFVGSVVTTIGYGTLAPRTAGGQILCVIYALFGIPLNLIFLAHIGKKLSVLCHRLGECLANKGMEKKKVKLVTIVFFLVTGLVVYLAIPPIAFSDMEGWSYREGFYFAFISLSTIGFGDYVVGLHPQKKYFPYYRLSVAVWVIFGLAWLALLFNLLTALLEDTEKKLTKDLSKKGRRSRGKEEALDGPLDLSSGPADGEDVLLSSSSDNKKTYCQEDKLGSTTQMEETA